MIAERAESGDDRLVRALCWLVAGAGRQLPEVYWQAIVERTANTDLPAFLAPHEVLSLGLVDRIVSPAGVQLVAELRPPIIVSQSSCPCACIRRRAGCFRVRV